MQEEYEACSTNLMDKNMEELQSQVTFESDISPIPQTANSNKNHGKNLKRLPLSDIINVQQNLTGKFDGKEI